MYNNINIDGTQINQRNQITQICTLPIKLTLRTIEVKPRLFRKYLATNYEAIRESPARITVRECENVNPTLIATFNYGVEKTIDLRKLNSAQIDEAINSL